DGGAGAWFPVAEVNRLRETPDAWTAMLRARRAECPDPNVSRPDQPFPEADAEAVIASYTALQEAYRGGDEAAFGRASADFFARVGRVSTAFQDYPNSTTTQLELWFNRAVPFQKAWVFSLLARVALGGCVLLAPRWPTAGRVLYVGGLSAYGGALAFSVVGFYSRVAISGRPPVSNMYESVIWVAFMCAVFGLVLELI